MEQVENQVKLVIADDHTLFRDTLVQYINRSDLNAKIEIAKNFDEAMQIVEEDPKQDLVLLDLRMPGMDGLESFKKVRDEYPDTPVALMSGVAEENDVREAFEAGAMGYFPKTMSGQAMLQAIRLVLTGERFLPLDHKANAIMPSYFADDKKHNSHTAPAYPHGMHESQSGISQNGDKENAYALTPREIDVLGHLARGDSNKEIANSLGLQVVTVKLHVRGVCRKLGAKNRTQAALMAQKQGLIENNEKTG